MGWSEEKRDWCCYHAMVGCTTTMVSSVDDVVSPSAAHTVPTPAPTPKQNSTVLHSGLPTQSPAALVEYDCQDPESDSWSEDRKKFCCFFHGVGCSDGAAAAYGWHANTPSPAPEPASGARSPAAAAAGHSHKRSHAGVDNKSSAVNASHPSVSRRLRSRRNPYLA